jgi:hypothetical protein
MGPTTSPRNTSGDIWARVVRPDRGTLSPEAAGTILSLDFQANDRRRVDQLSAKAGAGTLSPNERAEPEEYIRVNNELMILPSKARLSLKESDRKAGR